MRLPARLLVVVLLVPRSASLVLHQLAHAIKTACSPLGEWPEPEDAARACAEVIAAPPLLSDEDAELPLQGEMRFGSSVSHDERFAVAEPLANLGDSQAMQSAGLLLFSGVGGAPQDLRLSAQWHAAAVAQGNVDALATLGGCVRRGVGADQLEETGLTLINAAAAAGSPVGLCKLGVLYDDGANGLPQDSWKACQLFEAAAKSGSALGLFNHGWALVYGIGTARDVERGLESWASAVALAPNDGAEEAAFCLYDERKSMSEAQVARYRPGKCLKLAAALGYEKAVRELRRRKRNRAARAVFSQQRRSPGQAKFVRNDKARAFTQKELRGEALLEE